MNWYIASWFESGSLPDGEFGYEWEFKQTNVFAPTLREARSLVRGTDLSGKRFVHFKIERCGTEAKFLKLQGQLTLDFKHLTPDANVW